jgi:hypothetical protein
MDRNISVRIAEILTSGRFEQFYNECVIEKQMDERNPEFIKKIENIFATIDFAEKF